MNLVVLQKPRWGEPCNRCGRCCVNETCRTGMEEYQKDSSGPCPALIRNEDGTTECKLWEKVKEWITLGGCYAPD